MVGPHVEREKGYRFESLALWEWLLLLIVAIAVTVATVLGGATLTHWSFYKGSKERVMTSSVAGFRVSLRGDRDRPEFCFRHA